MSALDLQRYNQRLYLVSEGDTLSVQKAIEFESRVTKAEAHSVSIRLWQIFSGRSIKRILVPDTHYPSCKKSAPEFAVNTLLCSEVTRILHPLFRITHCLKFGAFCFCRRAYPQWTRHLFHSLPGCIHQQSENIYIVMHHHLTVSG